jgi:hypothetical protein
LLATSLLLAPWGIEGTKSLTTRGQRPPGRECVDTKKSQEGREHTGYTQVCTPYTTKPFGSLVTFHYTWHRNKATALGNIWDIPPHGLKKTDVWCKQWETNKLERLSERMHNHGIANLL